MRIDFYLLKDSGKQAKELLACRLLEKAYLRGHQVFVYCKHQQEAELLDELLWTFKEDSFIAHNLQGEGPEQPPAIQLGYQGEPRGFSDILLNLSEDILPFYKQFKRVIEIVGNNEADKQISRLHYKQYREARCELFTHDIE